MKIKTVSNGFFVKFKDDEGNKSVVVISSNEEFNDFDPYAVKELIYTILEQLGICINNRKYEKENISIEIKHGTHYECKDKNCKICKGDY